MINGIINVYKEKGYTSHDVVAKLRGIFCQKKIGHTGTLDPQAEGVLPVCLGIGTKLCDMLTDKNKTYLVVMRLGIVTDTQDMTGEIIKENEVLVSQEQIEDAIMSFVGEYEQIPPMYSAIKINGKKLYELAREGKTVERKPRLVYIYGINILKINSSEITFEVKCSKGTYIRTLCDDIGIKLGCGACMKHLTRTEVSGFSIENSLKLSEIEHLVKEKKIEDYILEVDKVLENYPKATVSAECNKLLKNGNSLSGDSFIEPIKAEKDMRIRVYDCLGNFIAIYLYNEEKKSFVPEKMFISS